MCPAAPKPSPSLTRACSFGEPKKGSATDEGLMRHSPTSRAFLDDLDKNSIDGVIGRYPVFHNAPKGILASVCRLNDDVIAHIAISSLDVLERIWIVHAILDQLFKRNVRAIPRVKLLLYSFVARYSNS